MYVDFKCNVCLHYTVHLPLWHILSDKNSTQKVYKNEPNNVWRYCHMILIKIGTETQLSLKHFRNAYMLYTTNWIYAVIAILTFYSSSPFLVFLVHLRFHVILLEYANKVWWRTNLQHSSNLDFFRLTERGEKSCAVWLVHFECVSSRKFANRQNTSTSSQCSVRIFFTNTNSKPSTEKPTSNS